MFYGVLDLPWWGYILTLIVLTQLTILSVTIYLHRYQAHRALTIHPAMGHVFRLWLWLTTGMITKAWAAIHRKHHAKCETAEDPHSPQILGLKQVLWEGAELYKREARNQETLTRYGEGTPDDWLERNLYTPYSGKGVLITLALDIVFFGVPGIVMWALQMMFIPFFAAGIVNGIGHFWGYRNFECPDAARNIIPFGLFIGGEELHNNHHTYPTSAKLSVKWFEIDMAWFFIKILSFLGLAKIKRIAPKPVIVPGKSAIDAEALRAIIANRIQVMTTYSKSVILPLFNQEKEKIVLNEPGLWQRIKTTLIREDSLVDDQGRQFLEQFLEKCNSVKVAYHFRKQLQAIWDKTTASQKELLEALHEWCQRAEATRIQKLEEFVAYLKGYTLLRTAG